MMEAEFYSFAKVFGVHRRVPARSARHILVAIHLERRDPLRIEGHNCVVRSAMT